MESMKKTAEKVAEAHEMKTSTSNKSESSENEMIKEVTIQLTDLPYPNTEKIYKTTSDKSTSTKLEAPEVSPSHVMDMSQISHPDTRQGNVCLRRPNTFRMPISISTSTFTSSSWKQSLLRKFPQKVSSTTSQTTEITSETSTPDKTEEPEAPEVRQTSSMSKISAVAKTEERESPEYFSAQTANSSDSDDDLMPDKPLRMLDSPSEKTDSSDEDKADEGKADEGKADEGKADEGKADEGKADEDKVDGVDKVRGVDKIDGVDIVKVGHRAFQLDEACKKAIRERIKEKSWPPISAPDFKKRPLVLATYHMMPSLPMELFEVFGEMIEAVTGRPVVLMYENRVNRPIIGDIDILITPANETWQDGVLFPLSFVFDHPHNKDKSASVYADIIVTKELMDTQKIQSITDLRGRRCAIPDRRSEHTAAGLLYKDLHQKGENMLFFGNLFDATSQLDVLEMILNNRAEVGIVESPVITSRKDSIFNVNSLHVLNSLGPLPPYRIMVKKSLADTLNKPLITYLMNVNKYDEMLLRVLPYGVIGFAKNSENNYALENKFIPINAPYY